MDNLTQAELLAVAVLRGDHQAALLLADEILFTVNRAVPDSSLPHLRDLGLSARGHRAVMMIACAWPRDDGRAIVGRLLQHSASDVLDLGGVGRTTLHEIRTALARFGLKLADDQFPK